VSGARSVVEERTGVAEHMHLYNMIHVGTLLVISNADGHNRM